MRRAIWHFGCGRRQIVILFVSCEHCSVKVCCLQQALAIILAAVGAKMVVGYWEVHVSIGAFLMFMFVILAAAMMASIAAVEREEEEAELLKRPQQLPAHFNPGLATHTVRSQPMLTPRGRKVPDWVSAQRLPPAQESTSSMAAGEQPTL